MVPSNEGLEPMLERARAHLGGTGDMQKLLAERFADRVSRLTPYAVAAEADERAEGVVIANLALHGIGGTLAEPAEAFGPDYASRPVRLLGVDILRPPRDGHMAFIKSPDGHSVELLQKGESLPPREPWASRPNQGSW